MACGAKAFRESWPARQQGVTDHWDQVLWDLTEDRHPTCVWWWNRKIWSGVHGAFCYICEKHIATYASSYPITKKAKEAVLEHRQWHIDQLIEKGGAAIGTGEESQVSVQNNN